jgi:hypothetical protein
MFPGVNFINILRAHFLNESVLRSFSLVTFWQKSTFVKKRVRKMLMKLTPGFPSNVTKIDALYERPTDGKLVFFIGKYLSIVS